MSLDDASGRLTIKNIDRESLKVISHTDSCSGLPVGVVGKLDRKDLTFDVMYATFAGLAPLCSPLNIDEMTDSSSELATDEYMLFVSTMGFKGDALSKGRSLALLQLLSGELGMDVTVKAILLSGL